MNITLKWLSGYRLALICFWLAAIYIVDPRGNFALDDDWVYAAAVKHLLLTHHFQLPWCSASLFTEALWGALFCKVFGFSFVTLRFSTLVIDLAGIVAFYDILVMLRTEKLLAFLGTLCFMFTPYFFNLSFTFMTDGFFCSCVILSLCFLLRDQGAGSRRDLIIGIGFAIIATLTRQIGLCIPIAWAIVQSIEGPKTAREWLAAWAPAILAIVALLVYTGALRRIGGLPASYNLQGQYAATALRHPKMLLRVIMSSVPEILIYVGLFLVPIAPVVWFKARRNAALWPRGVVIVSVLWIVTITPVLLKHQERIPFRGSTLENFRLGNYFDSNLPSLPIQVWYLVTLVGIISSCSVLFAFAVGMKRTDKEILRDLDKRRLRLLLFTLTLYFVPVFLVPDYLDRYILPAIPIAILALFLITNQGEPGRAPAPKRYLAASFVLAAGFALFSVLGTHDYLTYYRSAWVARQFVVSRGVPPALAFYVPEWGPAYFDGEYLNDDEMTMNGPVPHADSGYDVGTVARPGYETIRQYSIHLTLNNSDVPLFVSKRR